MSTNTRRARTRIALLTLALAPLALAACQTVKGLGKDIQYAGEKSEQAIFDEKKGK